MGRQFCFTPPSAEYKHIDRAYVQLRQKLEEKKGREIQLPQNYSRFTVILRYAAVAVVCFGLSWLFRNHLHQSPPTAWQTIEVPIGQRVKVTLADGTKVWLNSKTTFTYPQTFATDSRIVQLEGEAYFEVSHNEKAPFYVKTNFADIKVKGTKFNMYAYDNEPNIEASLLEGKIEFSENKPGGIKKDMKPKQRIVYNSTTAQLTVDDNIDVSTVTSWVTGIHNFQTCTMREIIQRLEHYYNVPIEVKDSSILDYTCTGKFRLDESLTEVLKVISASKPFKFKVSKDKAIIY